MGSRPALDRKGEKKAPSLPIVGDHSAPSSHYRDLHSRRMDDSLKQALHLDECARLIARFCRPYPARRVLPQT